MPARRQIRMRYLATLPLLLLPLAAQTGVQRNEVKAVFPATPVIVNGASFGANVSPGSIASIFGPKLANIGNNTLFANSNPLPTALGGVQVFVNGIASPIIAVSSVENMDQINFQVPYEAASNSAVAIEVTNYGQIVSLIQANVLPVSPGIFTFGENQSAFVNSANNTIVTAANPARSRDYVYFYATGLGAATNEPPTGFAAGSKPLSLARATVQVSIAGQFVPVLFAGLAPGIPGVYQLNVQLPSGMPSGNLNAVLFVNGQSSQTVQLRVR